MAVSTVLTGLDVLSLEFRRSFSEPTRLAESRERLDMWDIAGFEHGAGLTELALVFNGVRRLGVGKLLLVLWDQAPEQSWVRGNAELERTLRDRLMGPEIYNG